MKESTSYQNWKTNIDEQHILWLTLDKISASANTLNPAIFDEFEQILQGVHQTSDLRGLVIQSGKSSGFIAGADVEEFTKLTSPEAVFAFIRRGQQLFDQLAALPIPTVALIDGFCLGGGLELALACRYRIVEESRSKLGLPEVMLGIHPGWGGSVRLSKLIGAVAAMGLILTGRTVSAKAAKKLGFVDVVVPRRYLVKAATLTILNKPAAKKPSTMAMMSNLGLVRPLLARLFDYQLRKKVQQSQYPAPFEIVRCWSKNGVEGEKAFLAEAESLANLYQSSTAHNLVRVFFLQNRLKGLGKEATFRAQHVHVIGAGTMGGDIAAWCAFKGFSVTLQDKDPAVIAKAVQRAFTLFKQKLKDRYKVQAAMDRLLPDMEGRGVVHADVIVEAIFENLEVKQKLFMDLEKTAKPTAILATNTSSIPLDDINKTLKNPARLVGIHFFNPVAKMMLVEVVHGEKTDPDVFNAAQAFVHTLDKLPLPVKSSPGFLVNRVLMPYLMECMELLKEGYAKETIDKVAVDFGMPMGPVQLADTVGLDVCLSVARNLTAHFGGEVPVKLIDAVAAKQLGVKSGEGFYVYKKGKPVKHSVSQKLTEEDKNIVTQRLVYRILNECAACLREEVVLDSDLADAGMIFGTGFAPFRGGPMHYAYSVGQEELLKNFAHLEQQFGPRFKADSEWEKLFTIQQSYGDFKMKIPKSLDELKKMVSEVDVHEAVGKVKSTLETAGEVVKSVAQDVASKVEAQVEKIKHKGDDTDKKDKKG